MRQQTRDDAVARAIKERLLQIDDELVKYTELQSERERLQRFLDELEEDPTSTDAAVKSRPKRTASARNGKAARQRGAGGRQRAKSPGGRRSGSQVAVLEHLAQHPGASAGDIADKTGLASNVVYSILSRLASRGRVERQEPEEGPKQYRLIESDDPGE